MQIHIKTRVHSHYRVWRSFSDQNEILDVSNCAKAVMEVPANVVQPVSSKNFKQEKADCNEFLFGEVL